MYRGCHCPSLAIDKIVGQGSATSTSRRKKPGESALVQNIEGVYCQLVYISPEKVGRFEGNGAFIIPFRITT
jgi:hypothetical protein